MESASADHLTNFTLHCHLWPNDVSLDLAKKQADLYRLASQHDRPHDAPHHANVLRTMSEHAGVLRALAALAERGLTAELPDGQWRLTEAGVDAGSRLVHGDREDTP